MCLKTIPTLFSLLLSAILVAQPATQQRKLIWSEEFDYTGLPDSLKWGYEEGLVRNKEPQYYTANRLENARVENGHLVIEAHKESYKGAGYTSASITTYNKQDFIYGRIEVRAKVPAGAGGWPAIWMMGTNRNLVKWPKCGEIDIMEFLGKDSNMVYGTMHYADSTNTLRSKGGKQEMVTPFDGYHVYAIDWYKDRMEFYYDSLKYFVFDLKQADNPIDNPFRKKCYLLLNLALGSEGSWPGPVDETIMPLKFEVDYVRVYE